MIVLQHIWTESFKEQTQIFQLLQNVRSNTTNISIQNPRSSPESQTREGRLERRFKAEIKNRVLSTTNSNHFNCVRILSPHDFTVVSVEKLVRRWIELRFQWNSKWRWNAIRFSKEFKSSSVRKSVDGMEIWVKVEEVCSGRCGEVAIW